MKQWLMLLALLAVALSGCTGDDEPAAEATDVVAPEAAEETIPETAPETEETPEQEAQEMPETANENETAPNTAPHANLTADITSLDAGGSVTFTIEAWDAETSPAWSLDADGDGQEDANGEGNGTATFAFTDAGLYNATVTVNDTLLMDTASIWIEVTEPALEPLLITLSMEWGCWLCIDGANPVTGTPGAEGCVGWLAGQNEFDCGWAEIPAEYVGMPYSAFSVTDGLLSPALGTDGDVDVEFYDACASGATLIERHAEGSYNEPESGIIPAGAKCIVGFEFSWPNLGHTIEFSLGADIHS